MQDKLVFFFIVSGLVATTVVYLLIQISRMLVVREDIVKKYSRHIFGLTFILIMTLLVLLEIELTYIYFWAKDAEFLTIGLMDAFVAIAVFVSLLLAYRLRGDFVMERRLEKKR